MTRGGASIGPVAEEASISQIELGDVVQMSFDGTDWNHSPIVVGFLRRPVLRPADVLVAAHSYDAFNRPLSTYDYKGIRFLHFVGVRK